MEEWRDVPEYENLYQVSSAGQVRSLDRQEMRMNAYGWMSVRKDKGKMLRPGMMGGNCEGERYKYVRLSRGDATNHYIHRLVALAFLPNPEGLPQIDHINREKTDNRVSNLRWCTVRENWANK